MDMQMQLPKILLIEDSEESSLLFMAALEGLPCQVDRVMDGGEAVEILRMQNYDLVALDVNLPDCDGFSALKAADSMARSHEQTRFILFSGMNDIEDFAERFEHFVMVDHVEKPSSLDEIRDKVTSALSAPLRLE